MSNTKKNLIKILIVLLISCSMFFIPFESLGVPINPIQTRVVALFVMAALMWILEPIPIWTTSVLVITLSLLCISNQSLSFLKPDKFDKEAVCAIIDDACGPQADAQTLATLKEDVLARLSKKPKLDAEEFRQTILFQTMNVTEKASLKVTKLINAKGEAERQALQDSEAARHNALATQFGAAAKKLYTEPASLQKIIALKFQQDGDRYDKAAVTAIIDGLFTADADPASLARLKEAVLDRLDNKPELNADEVAQTLGYQIMNAREQEQAALSNLLRDKGLAVMQDAEVLRNQQIRQQFGAAADKLYTPEFSQRIKELKYVNLMQQKTTMATFADPIIILFLGGFFLAAAATKYRLDINLAKVLIKPFGTNPRYVMLGLMVVTALFSMFMSNTATAAMMLAILTPVLALFKPNDRGRAAFALCIPVAANIGGIGTPIGTPPNAIALKAMQDMGLNISFGKWMLFGIPFVIIMLLVAWIVLVKMFPIDQKELKLEVGGKFLKTPKAIIVYVTFAVTIALWVMGSGVHGLDSNTIAIIPIAVFAITQVITKEDLKAMSWDVLWLVAGGFALGVALSETGLANDLIHAIPFATWDPVMLMVGAGCICLFMATFMSHTATASLLMPILATVAGAMVSTGSMTDGGAIGLLCAIAFASSLGMALPISTPPNALAYATGLVESKGMAISGTILCLLGLVMTFLMMTLLQNVGFFG